MVTNAKDGEYRLAGGPKSNSWSPRRSLVFIAILSFLFWVGVAVLSGSFLDLRKDGIVELTMPQARTTVEYRVSPGQDIRIGFDPKQTRVTRGEKDLVIHFSNRSTIRLVGFVAASSSAPLRLATQDGSIVPSDLFLATLEALGNDAATREVLQITPASGR